MSASEVVLDDVAARERRWTRGRGTRRVGLLVSVAVIATTLVALVTNDRLDTDGSGLDASAVASVTTVVSPSPGTGEVAPGGVDPGSTAGGFASTDGEGLGGGLSPVDVGSTGSSGGGSGGGGGTTANGDAGPVVIRPVLQFLAFGGQIGMPLVCTLVASSVGQFASDPALVAVVGEIQAACVAGANQGADQLRQADAQLAALAAINPAVGPLLDQLATALETASQVDAPFASYLLQIVALIRFLEGK